MLGLVVVQCPEDFNLTCKWIEKSIKLTQNNTKFENYILKFSETDLLKINYLKIVVIKVTSLK